MNKSLLIASCLLGGSAFGQIVVKDTLFFTGSEQIWTVPCGASNVFVDAYGASGAAGSTANPSINVGGAAGLGNHVSGNLSFLNPAETLYVYVGGKANNHLGGFNGGGNGAVGQSTTGALPSGGGGGASDIRYMGNALNNRLLVAGGGGGGGNAGLHGFGNQFTGGFGGNGGGNQSVNGNSLDGANGSDTYDEYYETMTSEIAFSGGAGGGTETSVGSAGAGCGSFLGQAGTSGSTGQGGNGGLGNAGFGQAQTVMAPNGGGGGGGFVGGNGGGGGSAGNPTCNGDTFGAGGGGAAGSNYFDGPIAGTNGVNIGNGYVVFTYNMVEPPIVEIDENFEIPCVGEEVVIFGEPGNGSWSTIQGNSADMIDGVFSPSQEGTYKLVYSYIYCETAYNDTIEVTVNCTLGINDLYASSIQIYPNPTSEHFSIQNALGSNIAINDLTGKTTLTVEEYNGESIDVSTLSKGVYIVSILKNGQMSSVRLVKD